MLFRYAKAFYRRLLARKWDFCHLGEDPSVSYDLRLVHEEMSI